MSPTDFSLACARLHLTSKGMSALLGVSASTASNWARGVHKIPLTAELCILQMLEKAERGDFDATRKPAQ